MPIVNHKPITYDDLVTTTLSHILSIVQNADPNTEDHYSASVPAEFKPGYIVSDELPCTEVAGQEKLQGYQAIYSLPADVNLSATTQSKISSDFISFMTQ